MSAPTRSGELSWFRRPSPDRGDPGTLNACFTALDAAVVAGRSDEALLLPAQPGSRRLTFARVLEDVAAIAGVLRGLGTTPGTVVLVDLDDPLVRLACARVGAVVVSAREAEVPGAPGTPGDLAALVDAVAPVVVLTDRSDLLASALAGSTHRPAAVVVRGAEQPGPVPGAVPGAGPGTGPETGAVEWVEWEVALMLGRADPAGCAEVPADAPYSLAWRTDLPERSLVVRTVLEQAEALVSLVARSPVSPAELGQVLD